MAAFACLRLRVTHKNLRVTSSTPTSKPPLASDHPTQHVLSMQSPNSPINSPPPAPPLPTPIKEKQLPSHQPTSLISSNSIMAKLTVFLAAFAAFLLLADASIYRTTVIVNEENPRERSQSCREQIQDQQNLRQCQEYFMQEAQRGRRGRRGANPQEPFDLCCQQLRQLDNECQCRGLEQAIEQMQQQQTEQMRQQEIERAYDLARETPSQCGISEERCQFRSRSWF